MLSSSGTCFDALGSWLSNLVANVPRPLFHAVNATSAQLTSLISLSFSTIARQISSSSFALSPL